MFPIYEPYYDVIQVEASPPNKARNGYGLLFKGQTTRRFSLPANTPVDSSSAGQEERLASTTVQ